MITDQFGQVKARRDFMPFGEELYTGVGGRTGDTGLKYSSSQDDIRQKFTGYQKDNETGLDFAEARMYENRFGRFTAVDPLLASGKSANPQTFNRYIYVGNNPIIITDPSGLIWYFNKKLDKYDWYDEEKKKFTWGGGDLTDDWNLVTEGVGRGHFVYEREGGFASLDPNSWNHTIWGTRDQAVAEYGANSNYGGYGNYPVYGTFVLPMWSGIKTGNVGRAMYGFWGTALSFATAPRTLAGLAKEGAREVASSMSGLPIFNPIRPKFTGARQLDELYDFRAAEKAYDSIRNSDDVAKIASNSGMRPFQITRIKNHLFNNTHVLDDGIRRFDADPAIVNSWNRLRSGSHTTKDIQLLRHEYFESKFEGIFKTNYRTAHDAALRSGRPGF